MFVQTAVQLGSSKNLFSCLARDVTCTVINLIGL